MPVGKPPGCELPRAECEAHVQGAGSVPWPVLGALGQGALFSTVWLGPSPGELLAAPGCPRESLGGLRESCQQLVLGKSCPTPEASTERNALLRPLTAPLGRAGEAQEVTVAETRDGIWGGDSWWPLGSASSMLTWALTCP